MRIPNTPRKLYLSLTSQCNLHCSYCFHHASPSDVGDLSTEEWLSFFHELKQCAVLNLTLSGGEIFCRRDIKTLIQAIVDNHMRFGILTNGTLWTEDMAEFLAVTKRCNFVQVSVDGSQAAVHDATRGKGVFERTSKGIAILKKYHLPVSVRLTINQHNLYDLENIMKLLFEEIGISSVSTNSVFSMGACRHVALGLELTIEQRSFAMQELVRLNKKYNGRLNAAAGPHFQSGAWLRMQYAKVQGNESCKGGHLSGCHGILDEMAIRSDGVMVPCNLLSHIELGRINKDSLREVWQHHPELKRLRSIHEIPLSKFEFCSGCEYISHCTPGCPVLSHLETGNDSHPNIETCLKRFLKAGGVLPDIEPDVDSSAKRIDQAC